ncbi:MAG: type II toxin-antitoxin system Phd/YefM family antitoxin [Actinobacteria bacterium]|nr:type II toxin-antitoxin system Phd/YefM family antitoxin [Actinomycetota bacterium]
MPDVTATEAARRFSDLLDSVEHGGQRFTIVRHGKAVAHIEPTSRGRGSVAKDVLSRTRPDADWASDLVAIRELAPTQDRS